MVLLFFALIVPITPVIVNLAITIAVLFFFESLRSRFDRASLVRRVLRRHIGIVEHYREHPPRPFPYYLLFPIVAPLWLFSAKGRKELKLYRLFVVANVVLLLALKYLEYRTLWAPELSFRRFAIATAVTLFFQIALVFAFVVPTTVAVLDARMRKRSRDLVWFAVAFSLTAGLTLFAWTRRPSGSMVPVPVCARMRERTAADEARALEVREAAIAVADDRLGEGTATRRRNGVEISGPPLDAAREELQEFYRADETECFRLFTAPDPELGDLVVLRADGKRTRGPIWVARAAGRRTARAMSAASDLGGREHVIDDVAK